MSAWTAALRPARLILAGFAGLSGLLGACLQTGYVLHERAAPSPEAGASGEPAQAANAGAGGVAGKPSVEACEASFQSGPNFAVCRAEYWGTSGDDRLLAGAITAVGEVTLVGQSAGIGIVERRSSDGELLSATQLGNEVTAVVALGAQVLIGSDAGVSLLDADLSEVVAENPLGSVARLAASEAGVAVLTSDGRVLALDPSLSPLRELPLADVEVEDVAIDDAGRIAVTGSHGVLAGGTCQGRLPSLLAFDSAGSLLFSNYDFDDAPDWCASSTGKRLAIAGGKLYYAGEQQGGNSVHLRDPHDLAVQAPLVSYDMFSSGAGKAIEVYGFVGRFDLATGALEAGQVVLPRDGMVGGTLSVDALAVDAAGHLFLGGVTSCCIEQREQRQVAGQGLGAYAGPELSLLVLSPDLRERLTWTSFSGPSATSNVEFSSISVGSAGGLLLGNVAGAAGLLTVPSGLDAPGGSDGYFVLFPTP